MERGNSGQFVRSCNRHVRRARRQDSRPILQRQDHPKRPEKLVAVVEGFVTLEGSAPETVVYEMGRQGPIGCREIPLMLPKRFRFLLFEALSLTTMRYAHAIPRP